MGTFALALALPGMTWELYRSPLGWLFLLYGLDGAGRDHYHGYIFDDLLVGTGPDTLVFLGGFRGRDGNRLGYLQKAQNVVKTSLDLSRQSDGEESFGTSPVARVLVRNCSNISATILSIVPTPVKNWIDSRFNQSEMIMDDKASFDLVRASVNVVLSGLLDRFGNLLEIAFIYDVCGFHGRYGYFVGRPCLGA